VVLCGIFFGLGYSLGKNSTPLPTNIGGQPQTSTSASKGGKPLSGVPAATVTPCQGADCPGQSQSQSQNQSGNTSTSTQSSSTGGAATQPSPAGGSGSSEVVSSKQTGFIVQVAAVTRQEDAEVLVSALRKKNYPVFIASVPTDKLLHVQVGPFSDRNDAEAMRSRLAADGYNAILK